MPSVLAARQRHAEPDQAPDAVALLAELGDAVGPVADRLAALDRQGDAKGIIDECPKAADQRAEDRWHAVMSKAGIVSNRGNATYDAKLKIAIHVVRINFGPMLSGMGLDLGTLMDGRAPERRRAADRDHDAVWIRGSGKNNVSHRVYVPARSLVRAEDADGGGREGWSGS